MICSPVGSLGNHLETPIRHTGDVDFQDISTRGRLLVAAPPLEDPNFDRTVVFMLEHSADAAVGVTLNRPTDETGIDGLDRWFDRIDPPSVIFAGGPVETDALIAIGAGTPADEDSWSAFDEHLGTIDLASDPAIAGAGLTNLRIFRGYAGWGPGQLDGELAAGAWIVLACERGDIFTAGPGDLWRRVLRRNGGRLAWIADAPADLSLN